MRFNFLTLFFLFSIGSLAQDTETGYDCSTASFTYSQRFIDAYQNEGIDSAKTVYNEWVGVCGLREVTNRAYLLIALATGEIIGVKGLEQQYQFMFLYRDRLENAENVYVYDYNRPFYGYIPIGKEYDAFTASAFDELQNDYNPDYQFLLDVYSNEAGVRFSDLLSEQYATTTLAAYYQEDFEEVTSIADGSYSIYTGLWLPNDEQAVLGPHPEIGLTGGLQKGKWSYSVLLAFKFLQSREPYLARRETSDPFEETQKFFGGTIALDLGYTVFDTDNSDIRLSGGVGYDGFDVFNEEDGQDALSVGSLLLYGGAEYRYKLKNGTYLGLFARLSRVDYSRGGRVQIDATPLTIGISYGSVSNALKQARLKRLQYTE
jgi:hypothetical protein